MVILVVAITVLNIMMAMALPHWSHLIRRDKEEELRSRGIQYAEAIRVFQMRYGRLPVRLEELLEVKPRSIRRLWRDPMTADGKWGILFQGLPPEAEALANDPANPGLERITIGPIVGVHSKSEDKALSKFFGAATYEQWRFTVDLLQMTRQTFRPDEMSPPLLLRSLGRPFRPGLQLPGLDPQGAVIRGGQELTGANPPGGRPGQPGARPGRPGRPIPPAGNVPGFPGGRPGAGPREDGGRDPGGSFPGRPGTPGGSVPGFPGFPGGSQPPGGSPPGGAPGFDPTLPRNGSLPSFLPAPR